jgi:lysophospholipase L1-like esterase
VTDRERNANLPAVNAVYRAVAERLPRVEVVDLDAKVCPHGVFDPASRTPEGTHFADAAARELGPWFANQLARVWRLPTGT